MNTSIPQLPATGVSSHAPSSLRTELARVGRAIRHAALLALAAVPMLAHAEDTTRPTIFIAPIQGARSQFISVWQPAIGEGLAEMLITEVGKLHKFQVIESTSLQDLKDEVKLGDDGWVGADEKVEKGGWSGADFMFVGKITRFGAKSESFRLDGALPIPVPLRGLGIGSKQCEVQIDWRIVDAYNRKVIATGSGKGEQKGASFDFGLNHRGGFTSVGFGNQEFMSSALGKATVLAINQIMADVARVQVPASGRNQRKVQQITKVQTEQQQQRDSLRSASGKIVSVLNNGSVVVSLGSKQSFQAGDKLQVFEVIEEQDRDGGVGFTSEKLAGDLVLDTVQDERSKGIFQGSVNPQKGWIVRLK